jgi:phosphoserine phosphatase RsbU/P
MEPTPAAPGAARKRARTLLAGWEIGDEYAEDVLLVITELVANVVDHAGTAMTVTIDQYRDTVLIAVSDGGDSPPRLQPLDDRARRGRGLQLVDALCVRWGTTPVRSGQGKTVWAEIACPKSC